MKLVILKYLVWFLLKTSNEHPFCLMLCDHRELSQNDLSFLINSEEKRNAVGTASKNGCLNYYSIIYRSET